MDVRFWNCSQTPLVSPLHKSMKIEVYNLMYLQPSKVRVIRSSKDESSNQVDSEAFNLHQNNPNIPFMTELFHEYGNDLPLFEETEL